MDIIKKKADIHDIFIESVNLLTNSLDITFPYIYELSYELKKYIEKYNELNQELIFKTNQSIQPSNIFITMGLSNSIDSLIEDIYKKISIDFSELPSNLSVSSVNNVSQSYDGIQQYYTINKQIINIYNKNINEYMNAQLSGVDANDLHNYFVDSAKSIMFYIYVLTLRIDIEVNKSLEPQHQLINQKSYKEKGGNKPLNSERSSSNRHQLTTYDSDTEYMNLVKNINELKDIVFTDKLYEINDSLDNSNTTNSSKKRKNKNTKKEIKAHLQKGEGKAKLQRFGLIPMLQNKSLDEIISYVISVINVPNMNKRIIGRGANELTDRLSKISLQFQERKIGLYAIINTKHSQITIDIRALVRKASARKFNISENSGLNNDIIEKFAILKDLNEEGVEKTYLTKKMGYTHATKWVIIKSINGSIYDIMSTSYDSPFSDNQLIDKLERTEPSNRIYEYQQIANRSIDKFIRPPHKDFTIPNEMTVFGKVSYSIQRDILQYIEDSLEMVPSTLADIFKIVSGDEVENIISRILITSYSESNTDGEEVSNSDELASTFLYSIDKISSSFIRKLRENLAKSKISVTIFKEKTAKELLVFIRLKLADIVKKTVLEIFDSNNDLYEHLLIKKKLLNIKL
jgi:hypothetical protein